jgi:hypothetical protein
MYFNVILPSMPVSKVMSSHQVFWLIFCVHFSFLPCVLETHPSHPPWFDHPSNIQWSVHIMKFLPMQSSSVSWHFLHLKSKYSPQHPLP